MHLAVDHEVWPLLAHELDGAGDPGGERMLNGAETGEGEQSHTRFDSEHVGGFGGEDGDLCQLLGRRVDVDHRVGAEHEAVLEGEELERRDPRDTISKTHELDGRPDGVGVDAGPASDEPVGVVLTHEHQPEDRGIHLATSFTPLSVWSMNFSMMIGLAVGIDYALFIVSRYREEREDGKDASEAMASTLDTAGKAVFLSALTVALSLAAVFLVPIMVFRSMALGMIFSVVAVAAASLTLLPAVLVSLGDRVLVARSQSPLSPSSPSCCSSSCSAASHWPSHRSC